MSNSLKKERKSKIREIINFEIIKQYSKIEKKLDTVRLIYKTNITKTGELVLIKTDNKSEKLNELITSIFNKTTLKVKPFKSKRKAKKSRLHYYSKYKVEDEKITLIKTKRNLPIYLGCKGDNKTLKKCLNRNINQHIKNNFNLDLIKSLNLSEKEKKIKVKCHINKKGKFSVKKINTSKIELENEIKRIINLLPKVKPANQDGYNLEVLFNLPISL